ncbi:MAG: OB-fold domain-containing protein [Gammaproteobacteria bacterium]
MAGITSYGSYIPFFRLTRAAMGGGKGERAVASYDEDTSSMAVEAARDALRAHRDVDTVIFATTSPAYAEKLNTATIQAATGLPENVRSVELGGSTRMGLSALLLGADVAAGGGSALVCAADIMVGAPGGPREQQGGDAAVAFTTGADGDAIAKIIGRASATTELLDTWRLPEDRFVKQWEERFGAEILGPIAASTAQSLYQRAGIGAGDLKTVILDAVNPRATAALPKALGLKPEQVADPLAGSIGRTGVAHAGLLLARALDNASPGDKIMVASIADGCDILVVEVTDRIKSRRPAHSVDQWIAAKRNDLPYNSYLKWRGILPFEPPRRPDPDRPAAPPMRRAEEWKMAFVGSRCTKCGMVHLPPQRVCVQCGAIDEMAPHSCADRTCKIATFTLDHLAYSLQPPVVAAIADFDGGGRTRCELADVDPGKVAIGDELEMTFRRLFTGQGVHNYFWKARPRR